VPVVDPKKKERYAELIGLTYPEAACPLLVSRAVPLTAPARTALPHRMGSNPCSVAVCEE
jgi:hypothetical protein